MKLGIVGITGLVGQKIIDSLKLLNIKYSHLGLYASASSKGKIFKIGNEEHVIDVFSNENINQYDYSITYYHTRPDIKLAISLIET